MGFAVPVFRRFPSLDPLVLFSRVALPWHRHDGGIDNLSAHGQIAVIAQVSVELVEQGFDQPGLGQFFTIEPDGFGVGYAVFDAKVKEAHE